MKLDYVAHSEIGLVRKNNQDSGYASPTMLVVADGMGGAAAGDLASAVAVAELREVDAQATSADQAARLEAAVAAANTRIAHLVEDDESLDGMGTTVCGGMFDGETFHLIHIGDSRGYLLRDGELRRLTVDHTFVQSLVDDGKITAEEALYHPHRNLLLKVVNGHPANTYDTDELAVREGDRLLFCSDGLCGLVEDELIHEGLSAATLDEALDELVEHAHAAGGVDNITLVAADVVADDARAPATPLVLGAATEVTIPELRPRPAAASGAPADVRPTLIEDPEDARYRPISRPRRRAWRWLVAALVLAGLAAGGSLIGSKVLSSRYYVGADGEKVAIYQGVPDTLGPIALSKKLEDTGTQVADLPPRYAEQVRSHFYKGLTLEAVRSTTGELGKKARQCVAARQARAQATATPRPTPTVPPTSTPATVAGPTVPATASPTAAPRPTTTPTPAATARPTTPAATVAATTATPSVSPSPPPPEEC